MVKLKQLRSERLAVEEKAAREELELLNHTSLKVQGDVDAMTANNRDIVHTVRSLLVDSALLPGRACGDAGYAQAMEEVSTSTFLTEGELAQLKKLHQLTVSQVNRVDKKLKENQAGLDSAKQTQQEKLKLVMHNK